MPLHRGRQLGRGRRKTRLDSAHVGDVHADGDVLAAIGRDVVNDVGSAHRPNARGPLALERQPALHILDGVGKDNTRHTSLPSGRLKAARGWDAGPLRVRSMRVRGGARLASHFRAAEKVTLPKVRGKYNH